MLFLTPADLRGLDSAALEELLARSELTVAMGEGSVGGFAAAALLFADFAVLREDATLQLDAAEAWAGAVWRLGRGVLRLPETMSAHEARDAGLCDDVTAGDPQTWLAEWMHH